MTQIEIEEIINSIKSEYASNAKEFDGILSDINTKMETLADSSASVDVVKVDLNNLKTELENRHKFAAENFETISNAFRSLNENQELLTKNSDLKIIFDVLSENINNFAKEIEDQQIVINDIDKKIEDFSNDHSKKEEIIQNISVLKEALETFNRGFEASIMDINSNLRGIAKNLMTMDVTDQNDIIKRELENIYLTSNAILSTIEIIDQKNDDFAKITDELATKEDILTSVQKIGTSIETLSYKIEEIPERFEFPDLKGDFSNIVDEIKNLKSDLSFVTEKEIDFERLEVKINSIYEGFQSAIANLSEDKQQALFSLKDEISQIVTGIEALKDLSPAQYVEKINSQTAKIEEVHNAINGLQNEFSQKSSANLEQIVDEIKDLKIEEVHSAINGLQNEFSQKSSANLEQIVDEIKDLKIDEVHNAINGLQNEFSQKSSANLEQISDKIKDLKADLKSLNEKEIDFAQLEEKINVVSENFHSALENLSGENREELFSLKNDISQIIAEVISLKDLAPSQCAEIVNSQTAKFDEVSSSLNNLQEVFNEKSTGSLEKIVEEIEKNRSELNSYNSIISDGLKNYLTSIKELFVSFGDDLKNSWDLLDEKTEGKAKEKLEELQKISAEIKGIDENLIEREETYKEFVQSKIRNLYEFIVDFKAYVNSTNMTIENKVGEKLTVLENVLSQGVGVFNQRLAYLGQRIDICLNTVQTFSSETDIKFGNAVSELADVKEEIGRLLENLSLFNSRNEGSFTNFEDKFSGSFEDLKESLQNFDANFEALKYDLNQAALSNRELLSEIVDEASKNTSSKIDTLGLDLSKDISNNLEMMRDFIEVSKDGNNQNLVELNSLSDNIKNLEIEFSKNADILKTTIALQSENLNNYIESIKACISENRDDSGSKIADKLLSLESALSEISDSYDERLLLLQNKISEYLNSVEVSKNETGEAVIKITNTITEELLPVKSALNSFFEFDFNEVIDGIKSQIEMSYLNFSADVNENMNENHDSFVQLEDSYRQLIQKFAHVENVINDLNLNQMSMINLAVSNIEKCTGDNMSQTAEFINDWKKELSRLENKLDINCANSEKIFKAMLTKVEDIVREKGSENTNEIKDCISVMINNEDVLYSIETMNSELTEKLNIFSEELNNDSKKTNDVLSELKTFLNDISQGNNKFKELTEELSAKIDVLALSDTDEKIEELVQSLHEKIDIIADNDNNEKVEELINALHEKIDLIALSDADEKFEELIQALHDKVDVIALSDTDEKLEEMVQALHDKVDVIALSEADEKIEEMVNALHDKVDVLALSDDAELIHEIQDIKDLILEQKKEIEVFGDTARSSSVDKYLSDLLSDISRIEKSINEFDLEKNASDIKDSVMTAILSVADQISFAQETEEIKDFVEERTEEINKNLLDVKKQLNNIACNADGWDYSYTMQDIESDIAKLRIILNDISSSSSKDEINEISDNIHKIANSVNNMQSSLTQDQIVDLKNDFERLNDDIVSISSRTNKLLLTSDESYRALTSGLDEFSHIINDLEHRINVIDNREINERIENKIDNINSMVTSSSNSDKVMREVMMYLGEWIDGTSEKIDNIANDTADLHTISYTLGQVRELLPDQKELVNVLENKFEEQQNRIDRLEEKMEKILSSVDNAGCSVLESKIDRIENQLNSLASSIEKLASFVDEE